MGATLKRHKLCRPPSRRWPSRCPPPVPRIRGLYRDIPNARTLLVGVPDQLTRDDTAPAPISERCRQSADSQKPRNLSVNRASRWCQECHRAGAQCRAARISQPRRNMWRRGPCSDHAGKCQRHQAAMDNIAAFQARTDPAFASLGRPLGAISGRAEGV